jgi:hypothetical protein
MGLDITKMFMNPEDYKIEKKGTIERWYSKETNDLRKRIKYWPNGNKYFEAYYLNGNLHREDGPTYQRWDENGDKKYEEYYLINKRYSKEAYDKIILKEKWKLI